MKPTLICFAFLIIFSSFTVSTNNQNFFVSNTTTYTVQGANIEIPLDKIATMSTKEFEKFVGRKLTLKEKIILKLTQKKIKKSIAKNAEGKSSKGQTAFILSLIGLVALVIPYLSIASLPLAIIGLVLGAQAKKENPKDSKANTAIILSIVTLGLIVLAVLLIIAILATGFWY